MQPDKAFRELITSISVTLKEKGFTRSGQTFYFHHGENWGLINLQRSKERPTDNLQFTINLGIASNRVLRFFRREPTQPSSTEKPNFWDCHWQERIGYLLPSREDTWWEITSGTQVEQLAAEIRALLLDLAIPEILKKITDEVLRDYWLTGTSPGLTRLQRLEYLSVLLKALGPQEALERILEELRRVSDDADLFIQRIQRETIK